jgi:CHRD domain
MRTLIMAAATALFATAGMAQQPNPNRRATLYVSLTGLQEIPGPGDPDGNGTVEIRVVPRRGSICWNLYARAIDPATAAHIHRGGAGVAGAPVLALTTPDANGRSQGCATVDPGLAREIGLAPHEFYVNVHSETHPQGAIRGQLRNVSAPLQPMQQPRTGG